MNRARCMPQRPSLVATKPASKEVRFCGNTVTLSHCHRVHSRSHTVTVHAVTVTCAVTVTLSLVRSHTHTVTVYTVTVTQLH